jgi:hypothetical protein
MDSHEKPQRDGLEAQAQWVALKWMKKEETVSFPSQVERHRTNK